MTCCQIDLVKLLEGGSSAQVTVISESLTSIESYAALACIAIQSNQNDQHGGQSVPNFDYGTGCGSKKDLQARILEEPWRRCLTLCMT